MASRPALYYVFFCSDIYCEDRFGPTLPSFHTLPSAPGENDDSCCHGDTQSRELDKRDKRVCRADGVSEPGAEGVAVHAVWCGQEGGLTDGQGKTVGVVRHEVRWFPRPLRMEEGKVLEGWRSTFVVPKGRRGSEETGGTETRGTMGMVVLPTETKRKRV